MSEDRSLKHESFHSTFHIILFKSMQGSLNGGDGDLLLGVVLVKRSEALASISEVKSNTSWRPTPAFRYTLAPTSIDAVRHLRHPRLCRAPDFHESGATPQYLT